MAQPPEKILFTMPTTISLATFRPAQEQPLESRKLKGYPAATMSAWSEDGRLLAVVASADTVVIFDAHCEDEVGRLEVPRVHALQFSPQGTYLATFQRTPSTGATPADRFLKLWDWRKGEAVLALAQKRFQREQWPYLHLSPDEARAWQAIPNGINAFDPRDASAGVVQKLHLKGVGGCALSPAPGGSPLLGAYVPEGKGQPGFMAVWDTAALQKGGSAGEAPQPRARRAFFRATTVRLLWNARGTTLLALTACENDTGNKSYFGDQRLHLLAGDGSTDALVSTGKEGPVHDVAWAPGGRFFAVTAGFMPAHTTVFDERCRPVAALGPGSHNTLRWSPQGRFLAVCGFGNLPGDMAFYECDERGKLSPLGTARAELGVVAEWSPSGRSFLVATTAPRLKVDNGYALYRYDGTLHHSRPVDVLLGASWQPHPPGTFPDAPASPRARAAAAAARDKPAAAPEGGYVPPHLRGAGSATGGGAPSASGIVFTKRLPPGFEQQQQPPPGGPPGGLSKSAAKRKKAKEKGIAQQDAPAAAAAADAAPNGQAPAAGSPAAEASAAGTAGGAAAAGAGAGAGAEGGAGAGPDAGGAAGEGDAAKRARALEKKLRQIEQLRERQRGGAVLEATQAAKLASEPALLAELRTLRV